MKPTLYRYPHGITAIDVAYLWPGHAAAHLIVDGGHAAFVDVGTNSSVALLLAALDELGVARDAVDYVLLTHVHLDHAGGAGLLLRELPRARAVLHPRGAPHMIDPTRLVAAARQVYGEEPFARLYGELVPVPPARVQLVADGETLVLGGRTLTFLHTPGHALHHYAVIDAGHASMFTGDTFGVSYRELDTERGAFITPATVPSQFDPDAHLETIDRLLQHRPEAAYLMHFGRVTGIERLGASLKAQIVALAASARRHARDSDPAAGIRADMLALWLQLAREHGCRQPDAAIARLLEGDLALNTQGLVSWLARTGQAA